MESTDIQHPQENSLTGDQELNIGHFKELHTVHTPTQNALSQEDVNALQHQLFQEAFKVHQHCEAFKNKLFQHLDDEVYVISKKWYRQWKTYVAFKSVKQGHQFQYSEQHLVREAPGQISNSDLLKNFNKYLRDDNPADQTNFAIRQKCSEKSDFKLLPKGAWSLLHQKYCGIELKRFKDKDFYSKQYTIKFPKIPILILPAHPRLDPQELPKKTWVYMMPDQTVGQLKEKLVRCLNTQEKQQEGERQTAIEQLRLWKCNFNLNTREKLATYFQNHEIGPLMQLTTPDPEEDIEFNSGVNFPGKQLDLLLKKTFKEIEKTSNAINPKMDLIVVERATPEGQFIFSFNKNPGTYGRCEGCYISGMLKVICICKKVAYCNEPCRIKDEQYHFKDCNAQNEIDFENINFKPQKGALKGLVGLSNLGNTCYMNSALQCLSNTQALTQYFLDKHFVSEVNLNNPLGSKGELAFFYSQLLNQLWFKPYSTFSPFQLKRAVGQNNPMFQGISQHDSQEFLTFLLDTIHEDLNRVQEKPYIEMPDSNNKPDAVIAQEYWEGHLKRNQSVIVDLMQGQYKSTLTCPKCSRVSITFDPYMTIPLPIPQIFTFQYFFIPYKGSTKIFQSIVFIGVSDSMMQIKEAVAEQASNFYSMKITVYDFVFAQVDKEDFQIVQVFPDDSPSSVLKQPPQYYMFAYQFHLPAINIEQVKQLLTDLPAQQPEQPQPSNQLKNEEETKEDCLKQMSSIEVNQKLPPAVPLSQITSDEWIKVPLQVMVRQYRYTSFMSTPKFTDKEYIPRLLWLKLEWTLQEVHRHIFIAYSFLFDIEESEINHQYQQFFSDMHQQIEKGQDPPIDSLTNDKTTYPFVLNLVNPNKGRYFAPPCRLCGQQCQNCPLPIADQVTVRQLLAKVTHPFKFMNNDNVFKNADQLKDDQSSDEDIETHKNKQSRVSGNLQTYKESSEEEDEDDIVMKQTQDNKGKLKLFQLQLIFQDKVIKKNPDYYNSKLLSFEHHPIKNNPDYRSKAKKAVNIYQCIEQFRQPETLGKENSWYCSSCQDHVEATKQIELHSTPPILIFCLQRFKSHNISFKEKLEDRILFPIENLDVSPYVLSEELKAQHALNYDLYAVCNHYGSLQFGHYTAYCKNHLTGKWYDYNDSSVSELDSPSDVITSASYVLYYKRRNFFPEGKVDFNAIKVTLDSQTPPETKISEQFQSQSQSQSQSQFQHSLLSKSNFSPRPNGGDANTNQQLNNQSSCLHQQECVESAVVSHYANEQTADVNGYDQQDQSMDSQDFDD